MAAPPQPPVNLRIEVVIRYKGKRASEMMSNESAPDSDMEAVHMTEVQKDLLALGLPEELAKKPSAFDIMWKTGTARWMWVVAAYSVRCPPSCLVTLITYRHLIPMLLSQTAQQHLRSLASFAPRYCQDTYDWHLM